MKRKTIEKLELEEIPEGTFSFNNDEGGRLLDILKEKSKENTLSRHKSAMGTGVVLYMTYEPYTVEQGMYQVKIYKVKNPEVFD